MPTKKQIKEKKQVDIIKRYAREAMQLLDKNATIPHAEFTNTYRTYIDSHKMLNDNFQFHKAPPLLWLQAVFFHTIMPVLTNTLLPSKMPDRQKLTAVLGENYKPNVIKTVLINNNAIKPFRAESVQMTFLDELKTLLLNGTHNPSLTLKVVRPELDAWTQRISQYDHEHAPARADLFEQAVEIVIEHAKKGTREMFEVLDGEDRSDDIIDEREAQDTQKKIQNELKTAADEAVLEPFSLPLEDDVLADMCENALDYALGLDMLPPGPDDFSDDDEMGGDAAQAPEHDGDHDQASISYFNVSGSESDLNTSQDSLNSSLSGLLDGIVDTIKGDRDDVLITAADLMSQLKEAEKRRLTKKRRLTESDELMNAGTQRSTKSDDKASRPFKKPVQSSLSRRMSMLKF